MDFQKQKITVKELQQCCILRGIAKSGLKADLINRLENLEKKNLIVQVKGNFTIIWLI
jgi:hypothetical protein